MRSRVSFFLSDFSIVCYLILLIVMFDMPVVLPSPRISIS